MFNSNGNPSAEKKLTRRLFLGSAAGGLGGLVWLSGSSWLHTTSAAAPRDPGMVTIVNFSDSGLRGEKVRIAKVVKTEDQWRAQLGRSEFEITRHADTEIAYSGQYWDLHDKGLYRCRCCGNALFSAETKFESGTGWPSFWAPIAKENVEEIRDTAFGMARTAVACTECDAHLGHVFDDGPQPTGLRYCMNSASLRFVKKI